MPKQLSKEAAPTSSAKARVVETALASLLAESSRRGFYGTASLTLTVQDGCVQQVRVATDRSIR